MSRFIQSQSFVYIQPVKPRTKFLIGGALVIGTAGYLAASAIKDTGVYYLTPGELSAKTGGASCNKPNLVTHTTNFIYALIIRRVKLH